MRVSLRAWLAVSVITALAAALVWYTEQAVTYASEADEGYYFAYASRIAQRGPSAWPSLFRDHLQQFQQTRYYPPPTRLTVIGLDALAVRLWGAQYQSLQRVSLLAFLITLVVTFYGVCRLSGERTALWTALLLAVSPLHLAMARRALSDSLVAMLIIVALWLFLFALCAPYRASRWWVVAGSFLAMFLVKEGTAIFIVFAWGALLWHARRAQQPLRWWPVCAVSLIPVTGAGLLTICAAGGIAPAWQVVWAALTSSLTNTYAMLYGSGPWYRYLIDYLLLSPWTTILYLLWLGYVLAVRRADAHVWLWTAVPIFLVAAGMLITKNVRYLLALETPIRLGAVLLLQRLLRDHPGDLRATGRMLAVVALLMGTELLTFAQFFVEGQLYDPVSSHLLQLREMIPR